MATEAQTLASQGRVAPGPRRVLTLDNRYLPPLLIT
jgi:hypothetical protein